MTDFDKLLDQDLYVLVCEYQPLRENSGPVIFKTYISIDGSLDDVTQFRATIGSACGKTRIAKLQFIDEGETNAVSQ